MKITKREFYVSIKIQSGLYVLKLETDNDINGIKHLEIHHSTDEQFILVHGKAILITAEKRKMVFLLI